MHAPVIICFKFYNWILDFHKRWWIYFGFKEKCNQWRIQKIQNRAVWYKNSMIPGVWGLFWCILTHTLCFVVRVENEIDILHIAYWLQLKNICFMQSKIIKTQLTQNIFKQGGVHPVRRSTSAFGNPLTSWIRPMVMVIFPWFKTAWAVVPWLDWQVIAIFDLDECGKEKKMTKWKCPCNRFVTILQWDLKETNTL